jgi:phage terminase large subunit-like protein
MLLKFYMPADTLAEKERKEGGAQYTAWARAGLIVPTPGNWTDYAYIREDLKRDRQKYQLQGVAVDRWNASHMVQELVGDGVDAAMIGQGAITICPAARELDDLVAKEKLQHFGNPMLRWQMQNCVAKMIDDAGNVKPSKRKSTGRIDGIYAMLNAVALEISKRTEGSGDIAVYFG